jgi:membrane protein required for colicin V production
MATIDWIILAFLCWGAYSGFQKGLIVEVVGTFALIVAVLVGFRFLDLMSAFLQPHLPDAGKLLPIISFLALFMGVVFGLGYLAKTTRKMLSYTIFGTFDKVAGACLGATKVLISISAVLWFASFIGFKLPANFLGNSTMVPIAKQAGGSGYRVLASLIPLRDEPGKAIQKWFLEDKDLAKNKSEKN